MEINWSDGLLKGPDGPCRQIPRRKVEWNNRLFVTKSGTARWRHYNVVTGRWRWGDLAPFAYSETGRIGLVIDYWIPLETAIALAWLHREPESATRVNVDGDIHLNTIEWQNGEEIEDGPIRGEKWLKLKGKVGCVPIEEGYLISNKGRLKNLRGDVTSGFWFYGTRHAATNAGLVDLWVKAKIKPNTVYLRESLHEARECLLSGQNAEDLSESRGIQLDSAWSLINTAAMHVDASDLGYIGADLLSEDLWDLLVDMQERGDVILGGSLSDLKDYIDSTLREDGEYAESDCQWGEVRFGRLCIAAQTI